MGVQQHTLAKSVRMEGIGLHTGSPAQVVLHPAPAGSGLVFTRSDRSDAEDLSLVPAHVDHVVDTRLATSIGNSSWTVSTIEHLLAALQGLELDNITIDVDGNELPILDGSAAPWMEALDDAGRVSQEAPRRVMEILAPVEVREGDRCVRLCPGKGLSVSAAIEFDHPMVGRQEYVVQINPETFRREIGWARTFGFFSSLEALRRMGLIRGGSLENAVVFGPSGVINTEGLRVRDEPVRHKILDIIGDLSLLGLPLRGTVEAEQPGHSLTRRLVTKVLAQTDCWRVVAT